MLPAPSTDYTALLSETDTRWNAMSGDGAPTYVTYSFASTDFATLFPAGAAFYQISAYATLSAAQQADFKLAIAEFEAVSGLIFIEVDDPALASITVTNAVTASSTLQGVASLPQVGDQSAINLRDMSNNGALVMTVGIAGTEDYSPGTSNFQTILHELGHAVGLQHPNGNEVDANFDTSNTLMSYNSGGATVSTLQAFDVQALQHIYGLPSGLDGHTAAWDEATDLFTLTGTAGDDLLIAIDADSVLTGGDGDDALYGRDGDDTFTPGAGDATVGGGTGEDALLLSGAFADYAITLSESRRAVVLTGTGGTAVEGMVRAAQIDSFHFADQIMAERDLLLAILPDLVVTATPALSTLTAGTPTDVNMTVQNLSTLTTEATQAAIYLSRDGLYSLDDIEIGRASVSSLSAFETQTLSITLDAGFDIAAGSYTLIGVVDPDDTVVERIDLGQVSSGAGNTLAATTITSFANDAFTAPTGPFAVTIRQDLPGDVDALFIEGIYQGALTENGDASFSFADPSRFDGLKATFTGAGFGADTSTGIVTGLVFSVIGFSGGQIADLPVLRFGGFNIARGDLMAALANAALGDPTLLHAILDITQSTYTCLLYTSDAADE